MFKLKIFSLVLKIPKSIYIFIWCIAGCSILGYNFILDIINIENTTPSKFSLLTQIVWFLFFVWYVIKYLKKEQNNKL